MVKKELKLNSISRHSKQSPQLVLEEHSHCEVPAGCGGVVFRWRNYKKSVPIDVFLHTNGDVIALLDGKELSSSQPIISYGEHVFTFKISQSQPNQGLLMFAGIYDEEEMPQVQIVGGDHQKFRILSDLDGTWKYSLVKPTEDSWQKSGFDDSQWESMISKTLLKPEKQETGQYRFERLAKLGAQGLGIKETTTGNIVWVRKSFNLVKRSGS